MIDRNHDTGLSALLPTVEDMDTNTIARQFFDRYTRALLDREAGAIAELYAMPALIEFPDHPIAVSDRAQTEAFFANAVGAYEGVTEASTEIVVVAATGHSIWADVIWSYEGTAPGERFIYQLVLADGTWRIAVLTPLLAER